MHGYCIVDWSRSGVELTVDVWIERHGEVIGDEEARGRVKCFADSKKKEKEEQSNGRLCQSH